MKHFVFGKNVIDTLVKYHPNLIKVLYITKNQEWFWEKHSNFKIIVWTTEQFKNRFFKEKHQWIAAEISHFPVYSFSDLSKKINPEETNQLVLILDRIQDPQNFGAIIRSAVACGAKAVIVQKTKQAPINATLAKASAGTLFATKLIIVSNLHNILLKLKTLNFWVLTADMKGKTVYNKLNLASTNVALILGNEGEGVSSLLKKTSDFTTYLPMVSTESLNVNASAAILLYEIRRQQNFWKKS